MRGDVGRVCWTYVEETRDEYERHHGRYNMRKRRRLRDEDGWEAHGTLRRVTGNMGRGWGIWSVHERQGGNAPMAAGSRQRGGVRHQSTSSDEWLAVAVEVGSVS